MMVREHKWERNVEHCNVNIDQQSHVCQSLNELDNTNEQFPSHGSPPNIVFRYPRKRGIGQVVRTPSPTLEVPTD